MNRIVFQKAFKVTSLGFTPDFRFLIYFSGFSFFVLTVFGAFGLFQTYFFKRFSLSLGYVFIDFLIFSRTMVFLQKFFNAWNIKNWFLWLLFSVILAVPSNLVLHGYAFGEDFFSLVKLVDMTYYITLLFLLATISYGFVFKRRNKVDSIEPMPITITVPAENPKNDLILNVSAFLFAQSTGNYLEVYYTSVEGTKKNLIRSTIKKLVKQVEAHKDLMQCHQSFVVNLSKVKQVKGNSQNRYLILHEELENIPVSRRCSKSILEAFNQRSQNLTEYP